MRLDEFALALSESLSRVAYHYTGLPAALKILTSGEFQLSSTLGSVEQQYAPRGKPYFLSTTRTRTGGYHDYVGSTAVMFVLDGNWFNNNYTSKPVDYWGNRDPGQLSHRQHEAEDRVFSKDPSIPIGGVTAVHILVKPDADPEQKARARKALIAAKRQGIPSYFYTDESAWRNFDTRNLGDTGILKGQEASGGYVSTHPGYLMPWIELIGARDKSQLGKKANDIRYSLNYSYDKDQIAQSLNTDLSNARKPNSGPDRDHAIKLINFMRKNKLATVRELVDAVAAKWNPK